MRYGLGRPNRKAMESEAEATLQGTKGLTLVELLVALVLSSLLIAALYETFVKQHKTYTIQEQVVDTQQNVRAAIVRMSREIRMSGFGRVRGEYMQGRGYISRILPMELLDSGDRRYIFEHVINRDRPSPGWITVIMALTSESQISHLVEAPSRREIVVDRVRYDRDREIFDLANKRFISIDGVESNIVSNITEEEIGGRRRYRISLVHPLLYSYPRETPVYPIRAVCFYVGQRSEIGGSSAPLAENIEAVEFEYFDSLGRQTALDDEVRLVRLTVTARTRAPDPERKGEDGYRRRQISANLQIRNLALSP